MLFLHSLKYSSFLGIHNLQTHNRWFHNILKFDFKTFQWIYISLFQRLFVKYSFTWAIQGVETLSYMWRLVWVFTWNKKKYFINYIYNYRKISRSAIFYCYHMAQWTTLNRSLASRKFNSVVTLSSVLCECTLHTEHVLCNIYLKYFKPATFICQSC